MKELPVLKMFAADPVQQKQRCQQLFERLQAEHVKSGNPPD